MRPKEVMMVTKDKENTDKAMRKDSDGKGDRYKLDYDGGRNRAVRR